MLKVKVAKNKRLIPLDNRRHRGRRHPPPAAGRRRRRRCRSPPPSGKDISDLFTTTAKGAKKYLA